MDTDVYESNFCPVAALSADIVFPAPTGPTYSRIVDNEQAGLLCFPVLFSLSKPAHSRTGRFPSTHSTQHCLSITGEYFLHGFRPSVMIRLLTYLQDAIATILHSKIRRALGTCTPALSRTPRTHRARRTVFFLQKYGGP